MRPHSMRYAAANAALSAFAACVSVASERLRVCWNDEGFVLRTAPGKLHRFCWEQLIGYDTCRGVARLRVAGKSYAVNLGSKQAVSFLRALRGR